MVDDIQELYSYLFYTYFFFFQDLSLKVAYF